MRTMTTTKNAPDDSGSLMSIRLKLVSTTSHLGDDHESFAEALDIIDCMKSTDEQRYMCRDYLSRRMSRKDKCQSASSDAGEDDIDATCRWKMCEWACRVCDHFEASREIVAVAFSLLDRFIDKCCCDRTAFKLASMTTLYMAAKLANCTQISIANLVELGRGEFETKHLADMEYIILKTLDWTLNPPTVQAFVCRFLSLLPYDEPAITKSVYQRANFFAELSVYDYAFVAERRHFIAMACVLNAMEGVDDSQQAEMLRMEFLENVQSSLLSNNDDDVNAATALLDMAALEGARERLWFLYTCSAQVEQDAAAAAAATQPTLQIVGDKMRNQGCHSSAGDESPLSYSPVSVVLETGGSMDGC